MATHSSVLAWRTPRTEEPGELQSMQSKRLRDDWTTTHTHIFNIHILLALLLWRTLTNTVYMYKVSEQMIKSSERQSYECSLHGMGRFRNASALRDNLHFTNRGTEIQTVEGPWPSHVPRCLICVYECVWWEDLRSALLANFKYIIQYC